LLALQDCCLLFQHSQPMLLRLELLLQGLLLALQLPHDFVGAAAELRLPVL
jgi:hypothetical protein